MFFENEKNKDDLVQSSAEDTNLLASEANKSDENNPDLKVDMITDDEQSQLSESTSELEPSIEEQVVTALSTDAVLSDEVISSEDVTEPKAKDKKPAKVQKIKKQKPMKQKKEKVIIIDEEALRLEKE
jgi:hypothetical protein